MSICAIEVVGGGVRGGGGGARLYYECGRLLRFITGYQCLVSPFGKMRERKSLLNSMILENPVHPETGLLIGGACYR